MGGEIFVGIRYKDKDGAIKEQCQLRWTNEMPHIFMTPTFLEQGEVFEKFLNEARPRNEWPRPKLVKHIDGSEYGVILIDFVRRKVFSRNNYCKPGSQYTARFYQGVEEDIANMYELARRGWLTCVYEDAFRVPNLLLPEEFMERIRSIATATTPHGTRDVLTVPRDDVPSFEAVLNDKIFEIDHETVRPTLDEVRDWMGENGWTSKIKVASFGEKRTVKWMKPFPGAVYIVGDKVLTSPPE